MAGVIDAVGAGVAGWAQGQRVGGGWNGGYCGHCDHCRRGNFLACVNGQVTGITYDGGYVEYMIAPANAVALMSAVKGGLAVNGTLLIVGAAAALQV